MDDKPILTVELLRQLLTYNPETGELFWKERGPEWFNIKSRDSRPGWNTQWAGQPALNCRQSSGYRNGHILGHGMQAHRAAYAIQTGVELSDT